VNFRKKETITIKMLSVTFFIFSLYFPDANHQQYLDIAERKLATNTQSGHPASAQRIKKVILYIKMTMILCEERKTAKIGGEK
jgi:hypothetical protein